MASLTSNSAAVDSTASETFLPGLTKAFKQLQNGQAIETAGFCDAMARILPIFDELGVFFQFAQREMAAKVESLRQSKDTQPNLRNVVDTCVKDKTVTTKNSPARNLHRLISAVDFIKFLMQNLAKDAKMTLHNACYDAYNRTMANIHTFVVRTAVKAGMYTLPTREAFLKSLGESSHKEAKDRSLQFVATAEILSGSVLALYEGTAMPKSDSTFTG